MIARVLFRRLAGPEGTVASREVFIKWWNGRGMLSSPPIKRVYEVLRKDGHDVSTCHTCGYLLGTAGHCCMRGCGQVRSPMGMQQHGGTGAR
jgi:hypothetical protein